ncbi:hypothetical protein MUU46_02425 [Scandinavium sp. TWS1a]|uniref:hypothetical protein n=1 Tax=Scandinavium tedordense TaxID=2926521 RepID=UPI0021657F5A|nr:hypothetical protein [Scandinavium tedordense]MCS2169186.1 hypothetical protein [Scandinavium tedordense]
MRYLLLLLLPIALAGCATVSTTKTIQVTPQPGLDHIVINSNATARCKDIFFIISCKVNLEMMPVGGMDTSTQTVALATTPSVVTETTTSRLEELDKLKSQELISSREYNVKRSEILRGL